MKRTKRQSITEAAAFKKQVRASAEWARLRNAVYDAQDGFDYITGRPLRAGFNVHHACLDWHEYDNFNAHHFYALNKTTHDGVHAFYTAATAGTKSSADARQHVDELLSNLRIVLMDMVEENYD